MNTITHFLPYIQLALAILLVLVIIFQRAGDGMEGSAFGGNASNISHFTRRGGEKILFFASIIIAILFAGSAVFGILLS